MSNSLAVDLALVCRLGGDWVGAAMVARVLAELAEQGGDWVVLTQDDWDALCIPRHLRQRRLRTLQAAGELATKKVPAEGGGVRVAYSVPSRPAQAPAAPPQPPLPEPEELAMRPPEPTPKPARKPKAPGDFEAFWNAYGKKADRKRAEKKYATACKTTPPETIHAAAAAWGAAFATDRTYQPHPTTWLNGERWNDPPPTRKPSPQRRAAGPPTTDADLEARASRYYQAAASPHRPGGHPDPQPGS